MRTQFSPARAAQASHGALLGAAALASLLLLSACGGGGAAASDPAAVAAQTDTKQAAAAAVTPPSLTLGSDSFYFAPDASLAAAGALNTVAGGKALFAAWDPADPNGALAPGMKVMFFGAAANCASGTQGPLNSVPDAQLSSVAALTGFSAAAAASDLRWTPSGNAAGCSAAAQAQSGASSVFVNAASGSGAVGMLTTSGLQSDGSEPFLGPYGTQGVDGQGTNAGITGTFVNFRQNWTASTPIHPWAGTAAARLVSTQNVGDVAVSTVAGETTQAKQQMMATFLNTRCMSELKAQGAACQIQYLLNTAIVRSGVSDWSQVAWFQNGGLSYDPAQGSIPVIDGPIKASGTDTLDQASGLSLFTSQGMATQHASFSGDTFDVTISFTQLQNVLRMTTALADKTTPAAVTDAQIAALWGSGWSDRSSWVLLSSDVGQEVYNPAAARNVQIAGGFSSLFAGTQP